MTVKFLFLKEVCHWKSGEAKPLENTIDVTAFGGISPPNGGTSLWLDPAEAG